VGTYLDNGKARTEIVLDEALHMLATTSPASPVALIDSSDFRGEAAAPVPILPVRLHLALQVLLI
jgi:hypothetical protein